MVLLLSSLLRWDLSINQNEVVYLFYSLFYSPLFLTYFPWLLLPDPLCNRDIYSLSFQLSCSFLHFSSSLHCFKISPFLYLVTFVLLIFFFWVIPTHILHTVFSFSNFPLICDVQNFLKCLPCQLAPTYLVDGNPITFCGFFSSFLHFSSSLRCFKISLFLYLVAFLLVIFDFILLSNPDTHLAPIYKFSNHIWCPELSEMPTMSTTSYTINRWSSNTILRISSPFLA